MCYRRLFIQRNSPEPLALWQAHKSAQDPVLCHCLTSQFRMSKESSLPCAEAEKCKDKKAYCQGVSDAFWQMLVDDLTSSSQGFASASMTDDLITKLTKFFYVFQPKACGSHPSPGPSRQRSHLSHFLAASLKAMHGISDSCRL